MNSFRINISKTAKVEVENGILNLLSKKPTPKSGIPTKILKDNIEFIIDDYQT